MKHDRRSERIIVKLYGELSAQKGKAPEPDWEKSWRIIKAHSCVGRKRVSAGTPPRKWLLAGAAAALVFLFGIYLGQRLVHRTRDVSEILMTGGHSEDRAPLRSYAETLELLLIDFENRDFASGNEELAALEQEVIMNMLVQTRLLQYILSQREKDTALYTLLDDLELVLISMSNLRPEDTGGADQLTQFIRDRRLQFRLRQLAVAKSI